MLITAQMVPSQISTFLWETLGTQTDSCPATATCDGDTFCTLEGKTIDRLMGSDLPVMDPENRLWGSQVDTSVCQAKVWGGF